MSFDFASMDTVTNSDKGAEMTVLHPVTRQPLRGDDGAEIKITLAGQDSETYRKAQRSAANKRLAMKGRGKITAEELEAEGLELLARCTLAWAGVRLDGAALDCNVANAKKLYERVPWVREQADEFIADRGNFLGE